jgi:hypothetical protein
MTDSIQVLKPGWRALDASADVYSGAVLHFFDAGTSNTRTVYSNYGLSTSLGTTVTCDSGGFPTSDGTTKVEVYTGTSAYKVVLKNSSGTTIWTIDNIVGALDTTPFTAAAFAAPDTDCASDTDNTTLTTGMLGTVRNGNPTGGSFTYTLPSAITATNGKGYVIRHVGTANQINIASVLAQTIDGLTQISLLGQYEAVELVSDGANWHIKNDANRTAFAGSLRPQGYLTLTSGTPIISGDVSAATAVYYTPFEGNFVPIYDGTRWRLYEFAELTLTLVSQHVANGIYDVFGFLNSGVVTIGTGPVWTTVTAGSGARGTGAGTTELTRTKGLLHNTVQITARNSSSTYTVAAGRATYLGSIWIDGSAGQITCHRAFGQNRKWGVWNAYNRKPIHLNGGDSTATWTYTTGAYQQSRAQSGNKVSVFMGLAEEVTNVNFTQLLTMSNATTDSRIAIGWNSTSAASGVAGVNHRNQASGAGASVSAVYSAVPFIGIADVNCLEYGSNNLTFNGTDANMSMRAMYQG